MMAKEHIPTGSYASNPPNGAQQLRRAIHDEAGLHETLICYQELSTLIACADDLNPKTLGMLLDAVNRQFAHAIQNIESVTCL